MHLHKKIAKAVLDFVDKSATGSLLNQPCSSSSQNYKDCDKGGQNEHYASNSWLKTEKTMEITPLLCVVASSHNRFSNNQNNQ
jgi:hypothetical protein